jgi:DNA polymerase III epsilon subunit-like protein
MKRTVVYFDLETGGLESSHPIIQIAALAVRPGWEKAGTFQRKIQFDEAKADKQALDKNCYDPAVWRAEAIPARQAAQEFSRFLDGYKTIEMVSKRTGNPYSVARLAGYNSEGFDKPRLWAFFKGNDCFLPADPRTLDVLQMVLWTFEQMGVDLPNYQLATVARHLGIHYDEAHEALADVRMTVQIAQKLSTWSKS